MAASYKKLFKLLIDCEMKGKDLAAKAGISTATLAKMKKDGATVSSDVLVKICAALNCTMDDIADVMGFDAISDYVLNGSNNVDPYDEY